ncbi:hypoxia-inducible factor 1-alpha-like isoform X1 [Mytilus galloprovincialis]|uniref:hypoxia-inducible factor 1-alpha-like isoform X1 n=1 Tax=Mytilus galloprovincialis TaxID=29158 RepID=UPI003F7BEB10
MSGTTKRRSSEKRKEKSRDAARNRRSQEAEIFSQLCNALPVPSNVQAQLDKSSVMRIAISHLKLAKIIEKANDEDEKTDHLWMKALEGFVIILSSDVDIIFVSESVAKYLGISQIDLIGQSLLEFLHPCDHDEIVDLLCHKTTNKKKSLFLRMKCTLTTKGRSVNLKSASYKVIRLSGEFKEFEMEETSDENKENNSQQYYIAVGEPIPHPSDIEIPLDGNTFLSKHNMDMTFTYCDERIEKLIGYDSENLEKESIYNYHHALDSENLEKCYKQLFSKGQVMTERYRFLARNGGYVWVITQATIIYNNRTHRPESVVCVHYVLSGVEEKNLILAGFQKEIKEDSMLKFFKPSTEDVFQPKSEINQEEMDMYMAPGMTNSMMADTAIDLTHLAPNAGDACIPLALPFAASPEPTTDENVKKAEDLFPSFKKEPDSFIACRGQDKPKSTGTTPVMSPGQPSPPTPEDYLTPFDPNDMDFMNTFFTDALPSNNNDTLEELSMRAPYISMNAENDFQLYPPTSEELLGLNKDFNPMFYERTESVFIPKEKIFPDPPKETSPSLRDLLEAQNALSSIERPQDKQILSMKRPLDKSSLEKGPPAKMLKRETGPHTSPKVKSSFDSVLLNLLLTGEDKQYGYTTKDLKAPKVPKVTIAQPRAAPNISQPQRTILPGKDLWYTLKMMTPDVSM